MAAARPPHIGPEMWPGWWDLFRQVVMFLLGVALVIFSMAEDNVPFLVCGLVIFGIIPIERVLNHFLRDVPSSEPLPDPLPPPAQQEGA